MVKGGPRTLSGAELSNLGFPQRLLLKNLFSLRKRIVELEGAQKNGCNVVDHTVRNLSRHLW